MKIKNNTNKNLRIRFWEIVNEDDVNQIGVLDILKGEELDEEIPNTNFVIEELLK